jgi:hypothetical protein
MLRVLFFSRWRMIAVIFFSFSFSAVSRGFRYWKSLISKRSIYIKKEKGSVRRV